MEVIPLGSGSQGNCLLLRAAGQRLLVDQGFELEEVERRLARVGVEPREITALCMTHRHRDHARGVGAFCRAHRKPVFATRRTLRSIDNKLKRYLHTVPVDRQFAIGDLSVRAVPLSHDAPETVALRFDDGRHRFGIATDLGCGEGELLDVFVRLDALLLEFNYDAAMLEAGPYPRQLKDRVASHRGHLSNTQAADLLRALDRSRLRRLFVGHVSKQNNTTELALAAARGVVGEGVEVVLAEQDAPSGVWRG